MSAAYVRTQDHYHQPPSPEDSDNIVLFLFFLRSIMKDVSRSHMVGMFR